VNIEWEGGGRPASPGPGDVRYVEQDKQPCPNKRPHDGLSVPIAFR